LIVQIIAVIAGGVGVYKFFSSGGSEHQTVAIWAALFFYLFFGVFAAISYDYHSVVVASSIIPWFLIAIRNRKFNVSILLCVFMLVSQEDFAVFLFFVIIGLFIQNRKEKTTRNYLLLLGGLTVVYFILVIYVFIPYFSYGNDYSLFLYSTLGDSPYEAIKTMVHYPIEVTKQLFYNHTNNPNGNYVKLEFYIFILLSGMVLVMFRPSYIVMLIPLFFQKMLHNDYHIWSIGNQYSIQFAPILAIGAFTVISNIKSIKTRKIILALQILFAFALTIRFMDSPVISTNKAMVRIYKKKHYIRKFNVQEVYTGLKLIPKEAKVSAQSPFAPHLALRNHIYQFPIIKDADYIVYSNYELPYPLNPHEFDLLIQKLNNSNEWELFYKVEGVVILKRRN
jgi:uncharacterized membrane protein